MLENKSNNAQKGKLKGKCIPIYQHWGIEGHVKRNCFASKNQNLEYIVDLDKSISCEKSNKTESPNRTKKKNQYVVNKKEICLIVHIALKTMNNNLWYLDSGCSRHMSRDKDQFKKFEFIKGCSVTFGDGSMTTIAGKRNVEIPGLPVYVMFCLWMVLKLTC